MIIEQLRNLLFLGLLILVLLGINRFYPNNPICPDTIQDPRERAYEFKKWIDNFYENNPNASIEETQNFRRNSLARNNCMEALKEYNFYITESGRVTEEITEEEGMIVAETLEKQAKPICPFDFIDRSERFKSFTEWEKEFRKNNPNGDISDLVKARKQFYIENNCKEAPERPIPKDYGIEQTDETTQELLDIIENYNL